MSTYNISWGTQYVGMGRILTRKHEWIVELLETAEKISKIPIMKYMLEGPVEILNDTRNTQLANYLYSFILYRQFVLENTQFRVFPGNKSVFIGHSVGEFTALNLAESLSFSDTVRLLTRRGEICSNEAEKKYSMLALTAKSFKLNSQEIEEMLEEYSNVYISLKNSPKHFVLSGDKEEFASKLRKKNKKILSKIIDVSAPFHCPLLENAAQEFGNELKRIHFKELLCPVMAHDGNSHSSPSAIADSLKRQLIEPLDFQLQFKTAFEENPEIDLVVEIDSNSKMTNSYKEHLSELNKESLPFICIKEE